MSTVLLDTHDLNEAEEVLAAFYASLQLGVGPGEGTTRTRVVRSSIGTFDVDDFDFGFDMTCASNPNEDIALLRVRGGTINAQQGTDDNVIGEPGDAVAVAAHAGIPIVGGGDHSKYSSLQIERRLLSEVAANAPSEDGEPVRLTSQAVVSPEANRLMVDVIDDACAITDKHQSLEAAPLLASALKRLVASAMLVAFPNSALFDPTIEDRHDSTPVLVRRAISFIDDNAHRDISLADIALQASVTPRALQYMFRKHLDSTPMAYVRRVRLHYAHRDLVREQQHSTSVGAIARKWGYVNVGRFASAYRQAYGQSPHITLRS